MSTTELYGYSADVRAKHFHNVKELADGYGNYWWPKCRPAKAVAHCTQYRGFLPSALTPCPRCWPNLKERPSCPA